MGLEGVRLGEPRVAYVTLVGLLPGVNAEVPLQLEGVWGGVGAVRTLVGTLAGVAPACKRTNEEKKRNKGKQKKKQISNLSYLLFYKWMNTFVREIIGENKGFKKVM